MNITRNNYEEYFLLYADGELNALDKQAVEAFVMLHPDLAEELEMLKDAVLVPADIMMPGKDKLLRPALADKNNITSQQEAMLMLLDNELNAADATELQQEIRSNKDLQYEWNLLQQTKLVATAVPMPGKETLYQKERDRKPVPLFGYVQWMAAAAVVAGLGWYALSFVNNSTQPAAPVTAVNDKTNLPSTPTHNSPNQTPLPATVTNVNPGKASAEALPGAGKQNQKAGPDFALVKQNTTPNNPAQQIQQPDLRDRLVAANTDLPVEKTVAPQETNPVVLVANNNKTANETLVVKTIATDPALMIATTAHYKEDNVPEEGDEYINIAGAHIKKQKLRGVFRNVTRTLGRTLDKSNIAEADVASLR